VLQLWWGITEQTYLYYWHRDVWAVLVAWTLLVTLLVLIALTGFELWRAGYRAALRSASMVEALPRQPPPDVPRLKRPDQPQPPSPERRSFLAPPSEAFPGIRGFISRHWTHR
jgi:hypothetical protein